MNTFANLREKVAYTGNCHTNLLKVLAYLDPNSSSSYDNWELISEQSKQASHCVCNHIISKGFLAIHKRTKETIIVGSDCVGKFSYDTRIKANRLVRQLKNPSNLFCHVCLKKATKGILHKGKYYHKNCLKCSVCSKLQDCSCSKLKCLDCSTIIINKPKWSIRCYTCYDVFLSKDKIV